eukprot:4930631-Lingulodinium_polyedra.AAC.1
MFAHGVALAQLKHLQFELSKFRLVQMNETGIEGKHAVSKGNARTNSKPTNAAFSLGFRMPEWKERFEASPEQLEACVRHLGRITNKNQALSVVSLAGLTPHPELQDGPLRPKAVSDVLYHCDLRTVYQNLDISERIVKQMKDRKAKYIAKAQRAAATAGSADEKSNGSLHRVYCAAAVKHLQQRSVHANV